MDRSNPKPRNIILIIIALTGASAIAWLTRSYPPEQLLPLVAFYVLFALTIFCLTQFILQHVRRSFLIALGVTTYLILRSFNLRHPLYLVLLIALIISINFLVQNQKK